MITTRFGSVVEIVRRHPDYEQSGWVEIRRENGSERQMHVADLREDVPGEINAAVAAVPIGRTEPSEADIRSAIDFGKTAEQHLR